MKKTEVLQEMQKTNGRDDSQVTFTTLDQVWGASASSKYGTTDVDEYKKQLNEMTRTDLWKHATKVGFPPHDNIPALKNKLVGEFMKYVSQAKASSVKQKSGSAGDVPKEILDFLAC